MGIDLEAAEELTSMGIDLEAEGVSVPPATPSASGAGHAGERRSVPCAAVWRWRRVVLGYHLRVADTWLPWDTSQRQRRQGISL